MQGHARFTGPHSVEVGGETLEAGQVFINVGGRAVHPVDMPAVDSPAPGGLDRAELTGLLAALAPRAAGAQITVFDPDLDPDGRYAALLVDVADIGLGPLGSGRQPGTGERG